MNLRNIFACKEKKTRKKTRSPPSTMLSNQLSKLHLILMKMTNNIILKWMFPKANNLNIHQIQPLFSNKILILKTSINNNQEPLIFPRTISPCQNLRPLIQVLLVVSILEWLQLQTLVNKGLLILVWSKRRILIIILDHLIFELKLKLFIL